MTMVFGYAPLGSGGMSYCNQIPFPLCEGGVWGQDYCDTRVKDDVNDVILCYCVHVMTILSFFLAPPRRTVAPKSARFSCISMHYDLSLAHCFKT